MSEPLLSVSGHRLTNPDTQEAVTTTHKTCYDQNLLFRRK